ncbi:hypothetical protein EI969_18105 [Pseudomonas sp. PB101]|uniref:hypothetical protein n=1 Tax=Pseudomonas sp. PB101 TaxID=2495428 RepID=UPI0013661FE6|nr:hypothetical protein [Pseudomonas sp. PB101]MVW87832.1 hypothetical protein [Pseudomonas sp. PB101]
MSKRSSPLKGAARREDTREAQPLKRNQYLSFSFKYFKDQDDVGQSLATWASGDLLASLIAKLHHISKVNITELQTEKSITNYRRFPPADKTHFSCPSDLSKDDSWGVIRNIGGQKQRVAGFLRDNIFYIVFLDRDHKFWPTDN